MPNITSSITLQLRLTAAYVQAAWDEILKDSAVDRVKAEANMTTIYKINKLAAPEFVWVDTPRQAVHIIWERTQIEAITEGRPIPPKEKAKYISEIISNLILDKRLGFESGGVFPYDKVCYICERPISARLSVVLKDSFRAIFN